MLSQPSKNCITLDRIGDVAVVRFTQRSLLGADLIAAVSEQLRRTVEEEGCCKLVLNFTNVESMTSGMVGNLVGVHQKIEAAGGRLVLCKVDPFLREILKILNLSNRFSIHEDEAAALAAFQSGG
jgi:anti-anti-sigma factor